MIRGDKNKRTQQTWIKPCIANRWIRVITLINKNQLIKQILQIPCGAITCLHVSQVSRVKYRLIRIITLINKNQLIKQILQSPCGALTCLHVSQVSRVKYRLIRVITLINKNQLIKQILLSPCGTLTCLHIYKSEWLFFSRRHRRTKGRCPNLWGESNSQNYAEWLPFRHERIRRGAHADACALPSGRERKRSVRVLRKSP